MNTRKINFYSSLDETLAAFFGNQAGIQRLERISGGDINNAYSLTLENGLRLFLKINAIENLSFFSTEVEGLSAIASTGAIRTPRILGYGTDNDRPKCSFLLMEFVMSKGRRADYWETFGRQLAAMHQAPAGQFVPGGSFGFSHDNYIGATKQDNSAHASWVAFFRDCRLAPQFSRASHHFPAKDKKRANWLLDHLDRFLVEPERPSLLHGDLWSGNFVTGRDGAAWLIDPAAYVGHAEADLAMTELFGRLPYPFYGAYQEAAPLQPGYRDRRDLYNLYHLLNHLNLFGEDYLPAVQRILRKYSPA